MNWMFIISNNDLDNEPAHVLSNFADDTKQGDRYIEGSCCYLEGPGQTRKNGPIGTS